jgi:hypothetical protein
VTARITSESGVSSTARAAAHASGERDVGDMVK